MNRDLDIYNRFCVKLEVKKSIEFTDYLDNLGIFYYPVEEEDNFILIEIPFPELITKPSTFFIPFTTKLKKLSNIYLIRILGGIVDYFSFFITDILHPLDILGVESLNRFMINEDGNMLIRTSSLTYEGMGRSNARVIINRNSYSYVRDLKYEDLITNPNENIPSVNFSDLCSFFDGMFIENEEVTNIIKPIAEDYIKSKGKTHPNIIF